jgi:ferredoxin
MRINPDKCVACGNCTYVCPMGAIYVDPASKRATVDRDECVECYACYYGLSREHMNPIFVRTIRKLLQIARLRFDPEPDICPTAAFEPEQLQWPRVVRRAFSDPRATHESTGVQGRGTEEVKTNDVTHRVKPGEVGFTIEFGRPGVGVWFRDIQKFTQALAAANVPFEKRNPLTLLMSDVSTGTLREDVLNEKVLSAIVEIKVPASRIEEIILLVHSLEGQVDTTVALGVGTRCDENGEDSVVKPVLQRLGYSIERAKTNTGLGRISNPQRLAALAESMKSVDVPSSIAKTD